MTPNDEQPLLTTQQGRSGKQSTATVAKLPYENSFSLPSPLNSLPNMYHLPLPKSKLLS